MRPIPGFAVALLLAAGAARAQVVTLDDALFAGLQPVTVAQTPDVVYAKDVRYTAYPLAQVLVAAYPDWKRLIERDAVLIMRASGGYEPFMLFSEAFAGRAFVAVSLAERAPDDPYDCWTEGGEEHCDLGYFVIWTDGFYPDRPQPWGTYEFEVVRYEDAFGDTIPVAEDPAVHAGYALYKQYCIECHRINFQGGRKATDHVVRATPLTRELLDFFVRDYRKANPATYMPDFGEVLSGEQVDALYRYVHHMSERQSLCRGAGRDPRCPADRAN